MRKRSIEKEVKMKNLNELSKQISELIGKGMTDVSLDIGELHIPVKPKDRIAIEILWQLLEHPEIETVGDVVEVLQDAITWHQLFYIIKHSDEQNAKKDAQETDSEYYTEKEVSDMGIFVGDNFREYLYGWDDAFIQGKGYLKKYVDMYLTHIH